MPLLALDTSTHHAALALALADGTALVATPEPTARHGRNLVPAIRDLLRRAGLAPGELGGLAVGLGPGSFTGLRVGLMVAKALAYATGIPLVGLDSLEVVARNAPPESLRVSSVGDAQRGELFVADFARESAGALLLRTGATRIEPADRWTAGLAAGTLVLGPGLERLTLPLPAGVIVSRPEDHQPRGEALAALAREAWAAGRRVDPWFLEPAYLRRSAAEEKAAPPGDADR